MKSVILEPIEIFRIWEGELGLPNAHEEIIAKVDQGHYWSFRHLCRKQAERIIFLLDGGMSIGEIKQEVNEK